MIGESGDDLDEEDDDLMTMIWMMTGHSIHAVQHFFTASLKQKKFHLYSW